MIEYYIFYKHREMSAKINQEQLDQIVQIITKSENKWWVYRDEFGTNQRVINVQEIACIEPINPR